ncbi:MAG: hypothetical protein GYB66_10585 [Chloroflexi bacterium]|nr:hypothetical protein [Chloroflexota bacterium]
MMNRLTLLLVSVFGLLLVAGLAACTESNPLDDAESRNSGDIRVELIIDNTRSTYVYDRAITVGQFLDELEIERSSLDRINPPQYTQITDGMKITIVRVTEETECRFVDISFDEKRFPRIDMEPGEVITVEEGQNGEAEVCYRVIYEDGIEESRTQSSYTVITEPEDKVIFVGVEDTLDPVPIVGTLAYISNGQAYIMQSNSSRRRPLTTEGGLDGRVFDLSPDGRQLVYTRQTSDPEDLPFSNELWVILDTENSVPVKTPITNVLTAGWVPGAPYTIFYSTARAEAGSFQGWNAYNDLWRLRISSEDGSYIDADPIIEENLIGQFASWGTAFKWSPGGQQLAYAKADGVGLVDLTNGEFLPYTLGFPIFGPAIDDQWVWQPSLSWSADNTWVATVVHGPPHGGESPDNSVVFDIGVFRADGSLRLSALIEQVGMWANPSYSPIRVNALNYDDYRLAYLQAREPLNSYGSGYDLVVADRDGSNPRTIFPTPEQAGMRPPTRSGEGEFVWSPDGRQIAIVYQGDLFLVEVETRRAQQITSDGLASAPRWTP